MGVERATKRSGTDEQPRKPGLRDALVAFRHRNFRLFWIGALLSNSGTWMQAIAVPYVVFQITRSAGMVGLAAFLQMLPIVLFGPLGGYLADHFPRRNVLLVTQAASAVEAFVLWGVWRTGGDSLTALLVVVFVGGVITGLNIPSWQAFISELVPREVLLNAVTLNSTQFNAARALGPAFGGLVLGIWGASACFLINALSYVAVLVALSLIRLPITRGRLAAGGGSRRRVMGDFVDAARATKAYPGIRACFYAVIALGALGGPLSSLLAVFADKVFAVDPGLYGLLGAALGAGSIIAAPFIAGPGSGMLRSRLLLVAMFGYGIALVAFAATSSYAFALVALMVSSAGYLGIASTLNTTIQLQVPEAIRGKVLALYVMLLTLAMPVGSLVQGATAEWFGAQLTVVVAGVAFLAVTVWLWRLSGLMPHLDDEGALESEILSAPVIIADGSSGARTDVDEGTGALSVDALSVECVGGSPEVEEGFPLRARRERLAPPAGGTGPGDGRVVPVQDLDESLGAVDGAGDRSA